LPDPLPAEISLSTSTWTAINNATAALARLDGAARLIPSPGLLRRPTLRREAQSTSALEGTYAPFADVLAADLDDAAVMSTELHEVLNFERIAEEAFAWPEERPITLGALGELQRMLVEDTPGELSDAGGLRDRIVVVGKPGSSFAEARFVPPPPGDQLKAGAEELLDWMNNPPDIPTVLQAAMAHYQFETLHPYSDGNGRLGRLLVIVQLLRGEVIREPVLVVSPWFEQRRERYQDALLELSSTGDWDPWVAFFAEGVAASASESQQKVERLVGLREELRAKVGAAGRRGAAERLAGDLVGAPYVTAPQVAKTLGLTWQGATNAIRTLVELGILARWNRSTHGSATYVAPAVLDVLLA
jgi:Fic family protein